MTDARTAEERISLWLREDGSSQFSRPLLSATYEQTRTLRQAGSSNWRSLPALRSFTAMAAAGVAAIVLAVVGFAFLRGLPTQPGGVGASPSPSVAPAPSSTVPPQTSGVMPTELRRDGEFIVFEPRGFGEGWNLAARDPATGEIRTIVETDGLVDCPDTVRCANFVRKAEWSADGRWIAFEISNANLDEQELGDCQPAVGIWVQGSDGVARQLTTPCDEPPLGNEPVRELWTWSPIDPRLAYVRVDGETDELFVIDPSDGTRTLLVSGSVDVPYPVESSSLAWSADGSRIAYADGRSVYAVEVDGGRRSLLADSFEDIIHIAWSPTSSQILVHDQGRVRVQVMNADGSDVHVVHEGRDACCETAWSPNGDRIVYMLSGVSSEVWTVSPDGSNAIKLADLPCGVIQDDALPVWAPNGTQVAYGGCDGWVVENADGTGEVQPIDELVWRSWKSGGLTYADLAGIGQINH